MNVKTLAMAVAYSLVLFKSFQLKVRLFLPDINHNGTKWVPNLMVFDQKHKTHVFLVEGRVFCCKKRAKINLKTSCSPHTISVSQIHERKRLFESSWYYSQSKLRKDICLEI